MTAIESGEFEIDIFVSSVRFTTHGDASLTGWNASGKGFKGGVMPFMEFSDRDPIPKWDFQEPGARLKPLVTRAQFLATRHQYSCEQARCQTVQGITPRYDWSEFGRSIFGGSNVFGSRT